MQIWYKIGHKKNAPKDKAKIASNDSWEIGFFFSPDVTNLYYSPSIIR